MERLHIEISGPCFTDFKGSSIMYLALNNQFSICFHSKLTFDPVALTKKFPISTCILN